MAADATGGAETDRRTADLERALTEGRSEADRLRVESEKARQALERLAEAERLLAAVPDLERELADTIRERNAAIMELEQRASGREDELRDLAERHETEIARLREQVRLMESTRAWRAGVRYWSLRDRITSGFRRSR